MNTTPAGDSRPELEAVASSLALEALAARVVEAFRRAGTQSVLLRGATTARWLYEDGSRAYSDVDLLVDPAAFNDCERVLESLGFQRSAIERVFSDGRPEHASTWTHRSGVVDLHRTLVGLGVSAEEAWTVLSANTEPWRVGRVDVEALNLPARALLLTLHMAQHGSKFGHTKEDLERAIARVPEPTWVDAADLARLLQAETPMAAGLLAVRGGQSLCDALGLTLAGETVVEGSVSFHAAQGLLWLIRTHGVRAKGRYLKGKLFPPPDVMRARFASSRAGRVALIRAYGTRIVRMSLHVPQALWGLAEVWRGRRGS